MIFLYHYFKKIVQNILFGRPYDVDRYAEVLGLCALEADMAQMVEGDQTSIGDKGINLRYSPFLKYTHKCY